MFRLIYVAVLTLLIDGFLYLFHAGAKHCLTIIPQWNARTPKMVH